MTVFIIGGGHKWRTHLAFGICSGAAEETFLNWDCENFEPVCTCSTWIPNVSTIYNALECLLSSYLCGQIPEPCTLGMLAVLLTDCDGDFHKEREGYCCLQKVHYLPISVAAEHIHTASKEYAIWPPMLRSLVRPVVLRYVQHGWPLFHLSFFLYGP